MSSSASLDVQLAHSVQDTDRAAWDQIAASGSFASYQWYCFGETALPSDRPLYVIVSRDGEPVARATFWLTPDPMLPISSRLVRRLLRAVFRRRPLLICRSPLADVSGLILPQSPMRRAALGLIIQTVEEWARRERVSFVVFDYLNGGEAGDRDWPKRAASVTVQDPGTHLSLCWPDFDGYLKGLRQSARRHYRRHNRLAGQLGVEVRVQPVVADVGAAMALIRNVERRFDTPFPWAQRTMENMGMVEAAWISAETGGGLAACSLFLKDGQVAMFTLVGRDYQVPYAYFKLIYAVVRCAIECGARGLRGGSGAYDFKQRLGFEILDNNFVRYLPGSRALGALGRLVAS